MITPEKQEKNKDWGVVAIGRNEGNRLVRCLESLKPMGGTVVYVDSGSTDGSREAARERGMHVVELDLSQPFSMARARNAGFDLLKKIQPSISFVQFLDGDCELCPDWPVAAHTFMSKHPKAAAVCGRRRERFPEHAVYNRLCDIEWNTPIGETRSCGGDVFMRVDAFEQAGRFSEELIAGEEPELCLRLRQQGWTVWRIDAEMTRHDANILTFRAWWRRNVRGGYGALDVVMRLRGRVPEEEIPFRHMTSSAVSWTRNWLMALVVLLVAGGMGLGWRGCLLGMLIALGIVGVQALRIARGIRPRTADWKDALFYGVFTMIGKWAQVTGQCLYRRDRRRNAAAVLIEYKADERPSTAWEQDKARYPEHAFFREQSLWAIAVYRFGRWNDARPAGLTRRFNDRLYWLLFRIIETLTGIGITKLTEIGPGLRIHHFGNIFIHSSVRIGRRCTLRQGVTIGNRIENGPVPVVGNNVDFGAYAQVLGDIKIGDGARIGAMSVVLCDVPAGCTAVGIPARIITPKDQAGREEACT